MMSLVMKKLGILILLLLSLNACGPIYETRYKYTAPMTSHGFSCINNCLAEKRRCIQFNEIQKRQCDFLNEMKEKRNNDLQIACYDIIKNHNKNKNTEYAGFMDLYGNKNSYINRQSQAHMALVKKCLNPSLETLNNIPCNKSQYNATYCENTCNECYKNCGGKIESYQVCIAFCND